MNKYLILFMYHDTESYALFEKGIAEDYECTTALFIMSHSEAEALNWCKEIAKKFFKELHPTLITSWESQYECWVEDPSEYRNPSALPILPCVQIGEFPNFNLLV